MTTIHLDYLKPGMLLARNVKHLNGMLLATAGTMLTEKHLYMFRSWGITEAEIREVNQEKAEAATRIDINPAALGEAEIVLNERFRHTDRDHPAVKELFRVCMLRAVAHERGSTR